MASHEGQKREGLPLYMVGNAVLLAGAALVVYLTFGAAHWHPGWFVVFLALVVAVLPLMAAPTAAGQRVDAALFGLVMAAVFLGAAPAALIGALSMIVRWLIDYPLQEGYRLKKKREAEEAKQRGERVSTPALIGDTPSTMRLIGDAVLDREDLSREPEVSWRDNLQPAPDVLTNLVMYTWVPILSAAVFAALFAHPTAADVKDAGFFAAFVLAYAVAVGGNTSLHVVTCWYLDRAPFSRIWRQDVWPALKANFFSVAAAIVAAALYLLWGIVGAALWLSAFLAYEYLIVVGLRERHAKERLAETFEKLEKAHMELKESHEVLEASHMETIEALIATVHARDGTTADHIERCVERTAALYEQMTGEKADRGLRYGLKVHDVGKHGVPDAILNKPGKLTDEEWKEMHEHPIIGHRIVAGLKFVGRGGLDAILHHHERWDGTGYPDGLAGDDIPLVARLLAVVDAYDAMTSDRPYRKALPHEEAVKRLREGKETQFDPRAVDEFIAMVEAEKHVSDAARRDEQGAQQAEDEAPATSACAEDPAPLVSAEHVRGKATSAHAEEPAAEILSTAGGDRDKAVDADLDGQPESADRTPGWLRRMLSRVVLSFRKGPAEQIPAASAADGEEVPTIVGQRSPSRSSGSFTDS